MRPEIEPVELSTGVTLECAEQGDPSGVPVVLLHGISDSWRSYERVLPHLPESIRAIAPTQRGHGESSRPEGAYSYRDFAADVAALLDERGLDEAIVVGHSMGSNVAQRFAIDYPRQTRGLVLVSSFFRLADNDAPMELSAAVSTMEDPVDPGFVREFQESTVEQTVPEPFMETVVEESLKLPARVWREVVASTLEDDFSSELDRIEAPTLLIWGDRDDIVQRADPEAQKEVIPSSRLMVYEGAGHAIHWEEPERFASDLVTFVESISH
jgi:non-heme chloroperoxidase